MATYKHLRSSTANKRPTTTIVDGQLAINTNTASPGLFFKDSAGTGIVKVGPVHVGTTAPNSVPASGGSSGNYTGEQWLDTSVSPAQMKVWNGSTWVGIVADELPVSKLQDGAARQLIQTDAAGTGVEWTSNVDVPGTLDVTSTATFDSIAQHPLGTAGAPTITFSGDTNTGLYSPGADQVAISTGGSETLRITSAGLVGVGTSSPSQQLHVKTDQAAYTWARIDNQSSSASAYSGLQLGAFGNSWGLAIGSSAANSNALTFVVDAGGGNTERLRITSAGLVGIGTSSPDVLLDAQAISGNAKIQARETTTSKKIQLEANTAYHALYADGAVPIYHYSNGSIALTIDSSQRVGIGSTSDPGSIGSRLWIDSSSDTYYTINTTGSSNLSGIHFRNSNGNGEARILNNTGGALTFYRSPGNEAARIDSSGRLLVGTSSQSGGSLLQVNDNRIRIATAKTPASATDTGVAGEICWDANYVYVCTATNTWKRSAISTW
jgi:hypothetical protein